MSWTKEEKSFRHNLFEDKIIQNCISKISVRYLT